MRQPNFEKIMFFQISESLVKNIRGSPPSVWGTISWVTIWIHFQSSMMNIKKDKNIKIWPSDGSVTLNFRSRSLKLGLLNLHYLDTKCEYSTLQLVIKKNEQKQEHTPSVNAKYTVPISHKMFEWSLSDEVSKCFAKNCCVLHTQFEILTFLCDAQHHFCFIFT